MSEDNSGGSSGLSVKVERSRNVTVTEPEDVTREKAEAFLTLVSPFVNVAGIAGDWLGDLRTQLRTKRLRSLTAVVTEARRAIEAQDREPTAIPGKALLPILERASLEEPTDDALIKAWGSLLASASTDYDPEVIAFSRILSELSPRECLILDELNSRQRKESAGNTPAMGRFFESEAEIKPLLREAVAADDVSVFAKLLEYVDPAYPILFTLAYSRGTTARTNWIDKRLFEPFYAANQLGFTLLRTQSLIELQGNPYSWAQGEKPVGVDWAVLTDLGSRLLARVSRSSEIKKAPKA